MLWEIKALYRSSPTESIPRYRRYKAQGRFTSVMTRSRYACGFLKWIADSFLFLFLFSGGRAQMCASRQQGLAIAPCDVCAPDNSRVARGAVRILGGAASLFLLDVMWSAFTIDE